MQTCGIIIITHGDFGAAMLRAAERMLGPQARCAAISLAEGMGPEDLGAQVQARLAEFGPSLMLVDMLGGTPWNASLRSGLRGNDELISGLSLPLLLEALAGREGLAESAGPRALAADLAQKAAASFVLASRLLGTKGP